MSASLSTKVIIGLLCAAVVFAFLILILWVFPKVLQRAATYPPEQTSVVVPGGARSSRADVEIDLELLQQIKSQLSSIEARLQVLEQRPATFPPGLPSVPATLPAIPPLQVPDGSDAPWVWIEKLDPVKKVSVEKAFEVAAAAARSRMPPLGVDPDASALQAAKEDLDQDLANRLRSVLSPQEFEAYLSSLPAALRARIQAGKPENR